MTPLVVDNATKRFDQGDRRVTALGGVSISVRRGQFLAVMGASGSGKSTLLHLMAGLTQADEGRVLINDIDISNLGDRKLTLFRRRHIGLIFQAFNLIPTLTAEENIALPLMLERGGANGMAGRVDELLETLGLTHRRHHRPDAMSGGEQQRVAIGRALVADATVILADEPTGNLDSVNSHAVCDLLRNLSIKHNKTIVMVTHEPSVAAYAMDVAVLRDGKIIETFPVPQGDDTGRQLAVKYAEALR